MALPRSRQSPARAPTRPPRFAAAGQSSSAPTAGLDAACGRVGNVRVRNVATVGGVVAEADYASDPPCVLLALDARVEVAGPGGNRGIRIADFFTGFYETALAAGEIVTGVSVPIPP